MYWNSGRLLRIDIYKRKAVYAWLILILSLLNTQCNLQCVLFPKVSQQFVQHIVQQMPPGTVHQVVKMPGHMVSSGQPINQVPGQQVHIDTYKV